MSRYRKLVVMFWLAIAIKSTPSEFKDNSGRQAILVITGLEQDGVNNERAAIADANETIWSSPFVKSTSRFPGRMDRKLIDQQIAVLIIELNPNARPRDVMLVLNESAMAAKKPAS